MAYKLLLPKFGMAMESAKVMQWIKEEGDFVEREEAVLTVENEKLTTEIISMQAGVLLRKVALVGEKYLVGDLLAYLGEAGEVIADGGGEGKAGTGSAAQAAGGEKAGGTAQAGEASGAVGGAASGAAESAAAAGGRVLASPLAKKLAMQLGLDIAGIPGHGPGGRIEKADVEAYAAAGGAVQAGASGGATAAGGPQAESATGSSPQANVASTSVVRAEAASVTKAEASGARQTASAGQAQTSPAAAGSTPQPAYPGATYPALTAADYTDIPFTGIRQVIGTNMLRAWTDVPMVTHHVKADASALLTVREAVNRGVEDKDDRVSLNDLLLKLTAAALVRMPEVNASLEGDRIRVYRVVHLGMATALDNGLIVPVIHHADKKSLLQISREAGILSTKARSGKLMPDDIEGGTFTVTNLGGYGSVDEFTPIVNPPQAAILGVGRIVETPVCEGGEILARPMVTLSFTYDHRVIDGAVAARFIRILMDILANPIRTLCE